MRVAGQEEKKENYQQVHMRVTGCGWSEKDARREKREERREREERSE
jgi:hypothetical protein